MKKILLVISLFLLVICSAKAQTKQITGRVTEKGGDALIGVSVTIKGTPKGISTDANGNFKLAVPTSGNPVLVFKYIGFKSKEITVGNQTQLKIVLEDDATLLQEAVVSIGYAKVSRASLTGSVSSVSAKDLIDFPVSTAAEALSGKLAGVSVSTSEGSPGAEINIKVRGGGSLTQDNSPLYIVDGIQVENALSLLSPSEIQTIDVLKDVASTSIYGARGANGVVVITTKGGKAMRTAVTFDAYAGVRKIVNPLDVLDPYDFVLYQYELANFGTNDATKATFASNYGAYADLDIYKSFQKIDWQDKVFGRQAFSNTQNLSITGGSDATTFSFSFNNTNEEGIMLESGNRRMFGSLRFDHKISNKFKTGVNVRYSRQRIDGVGTSSTGSQGSNRLRNAVRYQPYAGDVAVGDVFDADYAATALTNPVKLAHNELKYDYRNNLISSGYLTYDILKNLTFNTTIGVTILDRNQNTFNGIGSSVSRNNGGLPAISIVPLNTLTVVNTNTLNYSPNIGKEHTLNLLLGQEINQSDSKTMNTTVKWFPVDITADQAFASIQRAEPPVGAVQDKATTSEYGTRLLSFFGRAMYSYKSKYNATLSVRRDGSSLFADGNQWGTFPSAQVAWRISDENFLKEREWTWLNNLKLRLSLGSAGNNRIDADIFKNVFVASSTDAGYPATDNSVTTGMYLNKRVNKDIKWETTISKNVGLDMDLFGNKLTVAVDLYDNNTKNLLLDANIPYTEGYTTQQQNVGKTQNKGIELQLSSSIAKTKDFSYTTSFNIAFNRNKIIALQRGVNSYLSRSGWVNALDDFFVEVGKPVGQFYGFISDGFYKVEDFDATPNAAGVYTYTLKAGVANSKNFLQNTSEPQPGDVKLKKTTDTESSIITTADRVVLGTAQPKFAGGFNNQFAYKNFDLSIFMNFSYGNKEYNANKIEFSTQYNVSSNNLLATMKDRWKKFDENGVLVTNPEQLTLMNADTKYATPSKANYILTSDAIEDGSFLRISNVTLGYSLPTKFLQRSKFISKLRFYGTVNNLLTITNYTGYDPEASTRKNALTPGVDYAAYPRSRYILAGLSATF